MTEKEVVRYPEHFEHPILFVPATDDAEGSLETILSEPAL